MPAGGTLTLAARLERDGARRWVRVEVRDTGTGMDDATQQRLFEPFFSTRAEGAGLGLATIRAILERAGGDIAVNSALGHGTAVALRFPLAERADERVSDAPVTRPVGRAILVVDDDAFMRRAMARVLRLEGFDVLEAEDGVGALEALGSGYPVGLVVTDVVMPRLGGIDLARRVHAERGLPVLLASGYNELPPGEVPFPFLAKPFDPEVLITRVREMLG
jgi:CheY-like chemotaxis protein